MRGRARWSGPCPYYIMQNPPTDNNTVPARWKRALRLLLDMLVLGAAALWVIMVSLDTLGNMAFGGSALYMKVQFWLCILFLADLVADMAFSPDRLRYLRHHIISFLMCVPYLVLFDFFGIPTTGLLRFVLGLVPLVRAVFVLAEVLRAMDLGRSLSMLGAYIVLLGVIVYFSSMIFYVAEYGTNPGVHSLRSAVYWAVMCMSTTGSNIAEYTDIGKVLASVLSGTGLVFFPVFTVYIADAMTAAQS